MEESLRKSIYGDLAIANSKYFQQYDVLDALEDNAVDSEKEILQMMGLYPSGLNPDRTRNECYGSNKNYKVTSPTSICPFIETQYVDIPKPTEKITEFKTVPKFINSDVQSNKKGRKK